MKKVLIVCAHFDDEVIGCSSILKNDNIDKNVLIVFGKDERKEIFLKLCKDNNINYHILNYEPFQNTIENKFNLGIKKLIEKINPDTIYTHFPDDLHIDHQKVSRAVNIACKVNRTNIKELYYFPIETDNNDYNTYIRINEKDKINLLNYYKDYINEYHFNFILNFNEYLGLKMNKDFIEPFKLVFKIL